MEKTIKAPISFALEKVEAVDELSVRELGGTIREIKIKVVDMRDSEGCAVVGAAKVSVLMANNGNIAEISDLYSGKMHAFAKLFYDSDGSAKKNFFSGHKSGLVPNAACLEWLVIDERFEGTGLAEAAAALCLREVVGDPSWMSGATPAPLACMLTDAMYTAGSGTFDRFEETLEMSGESLSPSSPSGDLERVMGMTRMNSMGFSFMASRRPWEWNMDMPMDDEAKDVGGERPFDASGAISDMERMMAMVAGMAMSGDRDAEEAVRLVGAVADSCIERLAQERRGRKGAVLSVIEGGKGKGR